MKTFIRDLEFYTHDRLYPTFKEWKPIDIFREILVEVIVYILPLRNENLFRSKTGIISSASLYPTFKEWKQIFCFFIQIIITVYILPLRNENYKR